MNEEYVKKMMNEARVICVRDNYDEAILGIVGSYDSFRSKWPSAEITDIEDADAAYGELTVYC